MAKNCQQCGADVSGFRNSQIQFCRSCSEIRSKTKRADKVFYCSRCGGERPYSLARHCKDCKYHTDYRGRAHGAVARAKADHQLPDLGLIFVPCVDCGKRAAQYDHRDYNYPLLVAPVCRSCNILRGPAKPYQAISSEAAA